MNKHNIILVEDDDIAAYHTKEFLVDCGFNVDLFELVTDAIANLKFKHYDILLLDLNLPDFDGFEMLRVIKKELSIPTIVISAYSDIDNKLKAFELGALDYIVKPYNLRELEARIWAAFAKGTIINKAKKDFEVEEKIILFKNKELILTQTEYEILKLLIDNANKIVSRKELAQNLSKISTLRSLDYHIKNIRIKINDDAAHPKYLQTQYGVGYILRVNEL